jgi:hypothetical protein
MQHDLAQPASAHCERLSLNVNRHATEHRTSR